MIADGSHRYSGYGHSVIGSIIANEGFIEQFATVTDPETGAPALNSTHVSLWQAMNFASQIIIQLIAPITADRFGRKFNMWALTVFLALVRYTLSSLVVASQILTLGFFSLSFSPSSQRVGNSSCALDWSEVLLRVF